MKRPASEPGALRRIRWIMAILAAVGLAVCTVWAGQKGAVSFALGAAVSAASFWSLERLGGLLEGKTDSPQFVLLSFRLFILFGAVYVILKSYEVFLPATISGLLLSVAAITLETLYQLIYARA